MASKLWILLVLMMTVGMSVAHAQEHKPPPMEAELSLVWGWARGSFGDNIERPMPGVVLGFGGQVPQWPLVLSTELGWLNYGFDDFVELRLPVDAATTNSSTVNVDARNSILMGHLVTKFVPLQGIFMPYIDGVVGVKYITSKVDLERSALIDSADDGLIIIGDNRVRSTNSYNALALSYGLGAGINIRLFNGRLRMQEEDTAIYMHFGIRFLFGLEADYLAENSIISTDEGVRFEQVSSDTDILIPKFGIQFGF